MTYVSVRRRLSFLDYMAGGCEIQCMLAVDFSSNNAPIDNPSSFHYAGEQSHGKRKVKHRTDCGMLIHPGECGAHLSTCVYRQWWCAMQQLLQGIQAKMTSRA